MTDGPGGGRRPADDERQGGLEAVIEEIVPALVARLRASGLGELEVRTDAWRVRLRRDHGILARAASTPVEGAASSAFELDGSVARSTAVGYFSPSAALAMGTLVQAGDVLGTVDVLGISHEVTAPGGGVISRVLAEDGQAVEFGQPLADIDALGLDLGAEAPAEEAAP